jgi:transposase
MARKIKASRLQYGLFATPFEALIAPDNPVRVIDAFVDALPLDQLGFCGTVDTTMGASSYDPADLVKIYFYGYFNRIRSSRMLEQECGRNIEMMWLIGSLTPCFRTIAGFRTYKKEDKETGKVLFNHRTAFKKVFHLFNQFLKKQDLFGLETIALDGTKIAAQNSKKCHISEDKTARKLLRIENRIDEYMAELEQADLEADENGQLSAETETILMAIEELAANKERLLQLDDLLVAAQAQDPTVTQICLTDPDARMLPINNEGMVQIAYNVQSAVDDKHCLIVDFSVENEKDLYLLAPMAASVKEALAIEEQFDLLADKGYHSGKGIHEATEAGATTYVAVPEQTYRDRPVGFQKEDFKYDPQTDTYTCPNKKTLKTTGKWHEKRGRQGHLQARIKLYRCSYSTCAKCPFKDKCLSASNIRQRQGRRLERSEYEEAAQANKQRMLRHRDKYKRRQAIVEHPFGTIKRSWGGYYTLLRRKDKVTGEMAIIFTCYNLRRAINILGVNSMILALKRHFSAKMGLSGGLSRTFLKSRSQGRKKEASLTGHLTQPRAVA